MSGAVRPTVRLATRSSALALWQARRVAAALEGLGAVTSLVEVSTRGDEDQRPFSQLPGSGFFTKAVQQAVLGGEADVAVHSFKDLPSAATPGLTLACVPERADARDTLLIRPEACEFAEGELPVRAGAVVGTSAARRREQLLAWRPDLRTKELRGNVPTRVDKLRNGLYDAVVLAQAGIERLGLDLEGLAVVTLPPEVMRPAPAQGALAVEARSSDAELLDLLARLDDPAVRRPVMAERGLMALFDAGCQLALGAHATGGKPGPIELSAWFEGRSVTVRDDDPQTAALLAFEALGGRAVRSSGGERAQEASVGAGGLR